MGFVAGTGAPMQGAVAISPAGWYFGARRSQEAELRRGIHNDIARGEHAIKADIRAKAAKVGKPGGLSPEEYRAYRNDMNARLGMLADLRKVAAEPGLTMALLKDLSAKTRNVGRPGGLAPSEFQAYLLDMKFRARHKIPGGPGSPYPEHLRNLVTQVNTMETIAMAKQDLLRDQKAKASNSGRAGGLSPEEFQAYSIDMDGRLKKLDQLEQLIKTYEFPDALIRDIKSKASNLGKAGGMSPEAFDAYMLDMAFRAKYKMPGPLGSPYPENRVHLVSAVNAMEAVSSAKQDLVRDMKAKAAHVGRAGGFSPEEYMAYSLDMQTRLQMLDGTATLLRRYEFPAAVSRDIQAKLATVGRAGGMSPEEFAAYAADLRTKAIGPGPLPGNGFSAIR
ncbi:MAG: hypothetical protein FJZ01_04370 [Candidatus Sericytochromatia bacterium]|nr:hypothetical protein [Candidatus Tanganyikabacteria bacterium]